MQNEIDAKDLFKKPSGEGSADDPSPLIQPTEAEMREAASPELSIDEFIIGGKTFKYRISNIRTQKLMAIALDAISDLLRTIDISPILKSVQERIDRPRKKILEQIAEMKKSGKEDIDYEEIARQVVNADENNFMDIVELVQDVLKHGGVSNIVNTIINLYTGIVYAVCYTQDKTVTREWLEDNLSFSEASEIFFTQMQKDSMGGRVIDFLYVVTRQVIKN